VQVSDLEKRFAGTVAASKVNFSLEDGMFLALLGPSGSGKTTVLRMIAGLETPDAGRITIHNRVVFDQGRAVPPEQRDIGMVFQDYALWPHMTVAQNIAFGLGRGRRVGRQETKARIQEALALVHLEGLEARYPDQLSGGQQQRVAIARAIATRPRLLLLDEPLSNLDAALREEMRVELVRLLKAQGITAIYVTHDRIEALAMADRLVVLREGRVAQIGSPEELYARPASAFIAGFLGAANFIRGEIQLEAGDRVRLVAGDLQLQGLCLSPVQGRGIMVLRPEDGALSPQAPEQGGNALPGAVIHSEFLGGRWRHVIAVAEGVSVQILSPERAPSSRVWVHYPPERCLVLGE
jgi:ABC-type Fe3+/spermidine/putrescine transport system ATPase subunit